MKTKKFICIGYMAFMLLLTGCIEKESPSEKIHKVLENVVAAEKGFEEQQNPLVSLEKQEKMIYDEIIVLGKKDQAKINDLADKAIKLSEKREAHMLKEQESLKASEKEFLKVGKIIGEIKEKEISRKAEQINSLMMKRYKAHDLMYKKYFESIKSDKKLYELFKQKDVSLRQLETQVNLLNENYKKVFELNKEFNTLTEKYNKEKLSFYNSSGMKIKNE